MHMLLFLLVWALPYKYSFLYICLYFFSICFYATVLLCVYIFLYSICFYATVLVCVFLSKLNIATLKYSVSLYYLFPSNYLN